MEVVIVSQVSGHLQLTHLLVEVNQHKPNHNTSLCFWTHRQVL